MSGAFVGLRLLVLVSLSESLLPFFAVLTPCEATDGSYFAYLIVDFVDILVLLELLKGSNEWDLSHDDNFLQEEADQTLIKVRIVIRTCGLNQSNRLDQVNWVLSAFLNDLKEGFEQLLGGDYNRLFFGSFLVDVLILVFTCFTIISIYAFVD